MLCIIVYTDNESFTISKAMVLIKYLNISVVLRTFKLINEVEPCDLVMLYTL